MMKRRSLSKQKLLARFLVPYVIILLMPFLIGSYIYKEALKVVERDAEKANLGMLEQIARTVDQRMNEMDGIIKQVLNNQKFQIFSHIEKPFEMSNMDLLINIQKEMENFKLYNNFLLNYFIAFNKSELILGPEMAYTYEEFFKLVVKYENKDFETWRNELSSKYYKKQGIPAQPVIYCGKPVSLITYVQSLSLLSNDNATVMVLIDEYEFKKLLDSLDVTERGWAYIEDEDGRILSGVNTGNRKTDIVETGDTSPSGMVLKEIDGEKMLVSHTLSMANGLKYVAVQPYEIVMAKVAYIKDLVFRLTGITIFLGLLAACYLAYRNAKPVREVVGRIALHLGRERMPGHNEFDYIKESLSELINDNTLLQEGIREQKPFLTAAFYSRLLKGDFKREEDVIKLAKHIGLDICGRYYVVGIVKLPKAAGEISEENLKELNKGSLFIKKLLQSAVPHKLHFSDDDEESFNMILIFDDGHDRIKAELSGIFNAIWKSMENYGVYHITLAMGGIYGSVLEVSKSYHEALQVMNIRQWQNSTGIAWHNESEIQSLGYYYPEDVEKRLINLTRSGERESVNQLLKEILNENLINRKLSADLLTLFVYDIFGTLMKLADQIAFGNEKLVERIKALFASRETNELELFRSGLNAFLEICDMVNENKRSHNDDLKEMLVDFVLQHYMEYHLSLSVVAEKFGFSEAYLSQFFKEQTGENFSSFLENIRMKKACELLGNTSLGINEIALQVGYSSSNTFCKVFKRVNGVNATSYRSHPPA